MFPRHQILLSILKMKVRLQVQLYRTQILMSTMQLHTFRLGNSMINYRIIPRNTFSSCFHAGSNKVNVEGATLEKALEFEHSHKSNTLACAHNNELCQNTMIARSTLNSLNLPMGINHELSNFCSIGSRSSATLKQNCMRSCQKRFYSNNSNNASGNIKNQGDGKMMNMLKSDDSVQNDPWVKSLLSDMQRDFDVQQKDSVYHIDGTNIKAGDVNYMNDNNAKKSQKNEAGTEYEYDYRYAGEDDIEEFGYFDKDDILNDDKPKKILPISLERGVSGVFELEEVTCLMEHLGCTNVVTVPIPPEANYCDYMVIVTAKSRRHLQAVNDEMLWVHKRKKSKKDPKLHIEGKDKSEWLAMDMGNVVLHVFLSEEKREYYDIESLWLLGPDQDPKCQQDQDHNSFALSAEDLYWLEVGGKNEPTADNEGDNHVTKGEGDHVTGKQS